MAKSIRIILILFVIVAVLAAIFELSAGQQKKEQYFLINRGQNLLQVANNLKAQGYIKSKISFCFQVLKEQKQNKILAGQYNLDNLSQEEIIKKITTGQSLPVLITIIPGNTIKDIGNLLERNGIISRQKFLEFANASNSLAGEFLFLKDRPVEAGLEGYFYPDTYQIVKNNDINQIAKQILNNFDQKLDFKIRQQAKEKNRSIFEIVTMASILEKEVKSLEDKKIVAGILWKRSDNKLPLEVDATLLYFQTTNHPNLDDKSVDSLYNTYKYSGLPKGPICNPSIESLQAATNPKDSPYWFYLTADDGKTIYSKTLGEHLKNKAKYIK